MRLKPVIDLSGCSDCGSCIALCPSVFRRNEQTGLIEVLDLEEYPEPEIREAISCCPEECIELEQFLR